MSLYDEFKNVNREYYIGENTSLEKDFLQTKERIINYFNLASKENLSLGFNVQDELRTTHSMSLVYLGLLLNEKLNLNIQVTNCGIDDDKQFNYIWNLLCFYHDFGYVFENKKSHIFIARKINKKNRIRGYTYKWNIVNSKICYDWNFYYAYNRKFSNSFNQIFMNNSKKSDDNDLTEIDIINIKNIEDLSVSYWENKKTIVKSQYYKKTIERYYNYRFEEWGVYDHGIIGGFAFFNSLVNNYIKKMQGENNKTRFLKEKKSFKIEQITLFSYIADCIVSHNIFFPDDKTINSYEKYELDELINFKKPITIDDNPLLFLLCLVDSIDPIKYFKDTSLSAEAIMKSIDIDIPTKTFKLSRTINSSINESLFKKYIVYICELESWLGIKTNKITDTKVSIKILIKHR